jgi:hypothetical protein
VTRRRAHPEAGEKHGRVRCTKTRVSYGQDDPNIQKPVSIFVFGALICLDVSTCSNCAVSDVRELVRLCSGVIQCNTMLWSNSELVNHSIHIEFSRRSMICTLIICYSDCANQQN